MTIMATGMIKTIRDDRGFGFITPDGEAGTDLFFHRSVVALNGFDSLREGQRVSFEAEPDPRDARLQRTLQVRPLGSASLE
jgi:CspA family cold shock protein